MKKSIPLLGLMLALFSAGLLAHGGGLDKNGWHRNNKENNYHCHKGPDAGKTYQSKEAYERRNKD